MRNTLAAVKPRLFAIALISLMGAYSLGRAAGQGKLAVPLILSGVLIGLNLLLRSPMWVLYFGWPLFWLWPASLALPIPVFNSPLMLLSILAVFMGFASLATRRTQLPPSSLYLPLGAWAASLILFAIMGHGPDAATRAQWNLQGLWTFTFVVLYVKTPQHARNSTLALLAALAWGTIAWLPTFLQLGAGNVAGFAAGSVRSAWSVPGEFGDVFTPGLSWQWFSSMAVAWPVLFSLTIHAKSGFLRFLAGILAFCLALIVILSTMAGAALLVADGAAFVLLFSRRRLTPRRFMIMLVSVIVLVSMLLGTASGQHLIERTTSGEDSSLTGRAVAREQGLGAFLARPITGWGAYNQGHLTSSGHVLAIHDSFIRAGYEYGILYLALLIWLLFEVGRVVHNLEQRQTSGASRAVVIGVLAVFWSYVIQGFVTGSLGIIHTDSIFWFFMGLAVVWRHWLDQDPQAELIAW